MATMKLMRLSEVLAFAPDPRSKERDEKFPGYYTHWCTFVAGYYSFGIRDTVTLVHGSQGCIANERAFLSTYVSQFFGQPFMYSPCTDLNSSDVILGGEEKLKEALLEVDKIYKPKMIFVLITCAPGVTKEPVEEIVEEVKDRLKARVMVIRAEGFTHYSTGILHTYIGQKLSELFEKPKKKRHRSVNILGVSKEVHHPGNFPQDSHELERLLAKIGIEVNSVLIQGASLEDFQKAPEAEFNTFVCPLWGYEMAKAMEERYGIPHGKRFNPLGITEISHWLMEVANFFGLEKETKKLIEEEYEKIKDVWEEAKRLVDGKIVLIDGSDPMGYIGRGIALGRMCRDLGMEAIFFNISPIEVRGNIHNVKGAIEQGYDPLVVYSEYAYHRRFSPLHIIEGLGLKFEDISLYLGDVFPEARTKDWDRPIYDPSNSPRVISTVHCGRQGGRKGEHPGRKLGFRGAESFARDVINAVKMARRKNKPTLYGRLASL